jgi:hypothetical protein
MKDCLHITLHKEHKSLPQGLAQCLQVWRKVHPSKKDKYKPKKAAYNVAIAFLKLLE